MEAFTKVTRKGCSNISHTLLTPPDKLHDKQRMNNSKGQKNTMFGFGLWCLTLISTIFKLYLAVSFIGGGNRRPAEIHQPATSH
jgi:hypothetical protein